MKGFYKYTYEISLIGPNEKKIYILQYEFFLWVQGSNKNLMQPFWNFGVWWQSGRGPINWRDIGQLWRDFILYIVETLNIHKVSNFELDNLIFVHDVTKYAQPPGPPFSKIF